MSLLYLKDFFLFRYFDKLTMFAQLLEILEHLRVIFLYLSNSILVAFFLRIYKEIPKRKRNISQHWLVVLCHVFHTCPFSNISRACLLSLSQHQIRWSQKNGNSTYIAAMTRENGFLCFLALLKPILGEKTNKKFPF